MSNSWKRRHVKILTIAFTALFLPSAVFAAGCKPPKEVTPANCSSTEASEQGGKTICVDTGSKGHIWTWRPDNYNLSSAVTVVYMHGHDIDVTPRGGHYIDKAWKHHRLAEQFKKSGLNALFIAPEGPTDSGQSVKWTSLTDLLNKVKSETGIDPPQRVVTIGHSAGMFTTVYFRNDSRVIHMVSMDSMYGKTAGTTVPDRLDEVTRLRSAVKITLAGGSDQNGKMKTFTESHPGFTEVSGYPSTLSSEQKSAKYLWFNSTKNHCDLASGGQALPVILQRAGDALGTSSGGLSLSIDPRVKELATPRLEIPIPFVKFTDPILNDDRITLPFIAQYIGGIYQFLIGIVGVVAALMIMYGGYLYITSRGDKDRAKEGRRRILNAVIGLVLAFGSYLILFVINPSLVSFEGLKLTKVSSETIGVDDHDRGAIPEPGDNRAPKPICTTIADCKSKYCDTDPSTWPKFNTGMLDPSLVKTIEETPGVINPRGQKASDSVRAGLKRAGEIAVQMNPSYVIMVRSGYRSLAGQINGACRAINSGKPENVGGIVAWPGSSNHGAGYAVDMQLWEGDIKRNKSGRATGVDGKILVTSSSASQKEDRWKEGSIILDQIMTKAGWRRYAREIWHYEFGSTTGCRCTYPNCPFPPPSSCSYNK